MITAPANEAGIPAIEERKTMRVLAQAAAAGLALVALPPRGSAKASRGSFDSDDELHEWIRSKVASLASLEREAGGRH
jgi:hypothetical protein